MSLLPDRISRIYIFSLVSLVLIVGVGYVYMTSRVDPAHRIWLEHCAGCHGSDMQGTALGPPVKTQFSGRDASLSERVQFIVKKHAVSDQASAFAVLTSTQIELLVIYLGERAQKFPQTASSYKHVPEADRTIESGYHRFQLQRLAKLQSRPYSIAPLPDGRVLVTEKIRGLSIIERDGQQNTLIPGIPKVWDTLVSWNGSWANWGIVLDVQLHPDFKNNGWIYLSHTDRCQWECGWPVPATMVRVVRGRLKEGRWIDQEVIWSVPKEHYTPVPDAVAAGRLAFDHSGYIYISVGGKSTYDKLHDLHTPFGKIHRVHDDGRVPEDNPLWSPPSERPESSTRHTVWSYGHRTAQGLDVDPASGDIWNTEMGPRGGDEINRIIAAGNYGWPLYTNGLDYDGAQITIGKDLGLDFPIESTVLPIRDWTPAPAVSNFTFYSGDMFAEWQGDMLVGTLKAMTLYRVRIKENQWIEEEKLITEFGRIRDVETGFDGSVFIAIEHEEHGSLWRISVPRPIR
jgi:glucose/arabinose dehydrogenase